MRTPESDHLFAVARIVSEAYTHPRRAASMVTGSICDGTCDRYSDVDMSMYYEELPDDETLQQSRRDVGGAERRWSVDERPNAFVEAFLRDGVEIQIGHVTIDQWERDIDRVLSAQIVRTPLHKAMSGTLKCVPLEGADRIDAWKSRIARFPEPLRRAMVEEYLKVFSYWGIVDCMESRDGEIWRHEMCVEAAYNLLGVLAGLNGVYYTSFQLKRVQDLIEHDLPIRPDDLYRRISRFIDPDVRAATGTMEQLTADVLELVEQHMPAVDTTSLRERIGWRHEPWRLSTA